MDFQVILSFTRSLLTPFCLRSILITSSHVFFGLPLPVVPVTLIALHLLAQAFLPILSTCLYQQSLLFCIQLPILSRCNLFLSSLELSLSFTPTSYHCHVILLHAADIFSFHWPSFIAIHHCVMYTCLVDSTCFYLPLVGNDRALLINNGISSLNLLHSLLILAAMLPAAPPSAPMVSPR